jgi:hypothetical protein
MLEFSTDNCVAFVVLRKSCWYSLNNVITEVASICSCCKSELGRISVMYLKEAVGAGKLLNYLTSLKKTISLWMTYHVLSQSRNSSPFINYRDSVLLHRCPPVDPVVSYVNPVYTATPFSSHLHTGLHSSHFHSSFPKKTWIFSPFFVLNVSLPNSTSLHFN